MGRVKKKDYEDLTDTNIQKVIGLMNTETEKPITKKQACDILNIAYNTTRLDKIISEYLDHKEYVLRRKSVNKGKKATAGEINSAISDYLSGDSISVIAKSLYRSPSFVKNIIEKSGVPQRPNKRAERLQPMYLPEECVADSFVKGQIVWSAKYYSAAEVLDEISVDYQAEKLGYNDTDYEKKYSSKSYSIYVMKPIATSDEFLVQGPSMGGFYAFALACELGSLEHLKEHGIDLSRI